MYSWFFICAVGIIATIPLYFLSVEHQKLHEKYGQKKGTRIGELCGVVSGWGFFLSWLGLWLSPQPRFTVPVLQDLSVRVPTVDFSFPLLHLAIFAPFFTIGAWLGIGGVQETTLRTAETHRPEKLATRGVYSLVRHPQYLGGLLAHVGISFLLSAWYSLLSTPLMVAIIYLISRKEEKELLKEFGNEYEDYMKTVPMLLPKLRRRQETSEEARQISVRSQSSKDTAPIQLCAYFSAERLQRSSHSKNMNRGSCIANLRYRCNCSPNHGQRLVRTSQNSVPRLLVRLNHIKPCLTRTNLTEQA